MTHCFIGLDIGRYTIVACVVDETGQPLDTFEFPQTHQGYEQAIGKIKQLSQSGLTPVVSAEGHDGNIAPLDEYLMTEGYIFKPLHPVAVSRYKEVLGQPQKTDAYDAYVIADLLRVVHQRTPQKFISTTAAEIKSLSRTYKSLTKTRTRFVNQLQQEIMSYFPELMTHKIFSTLTGKAALNLLGTYPTPEKIATTPLKELTNLLAVASKNHLGEETAMKLIALGKTVGRSPKTIESKAAVVSALAKTLLAVIESQNQLKKQMKQITDSSISLQRLMSIPGISVILAARLLGELITLDRFESEAKLAMFVGVAPVADDSGKRQGRHRTTHRVNKVAKDAMMQIALCSSRVCDTSKNYYQKKRQQGKSHWQAIKCLARQLVKVIFALFRAEQFYQPTKNG